MAVSYGVATKFSCLSLAEKLVVPALSKLSNFVPGGGIWMNTQRPEWNDANNALVGNGLSMVTLLYLRRYLHHLRSLVAEDELSDFVGSRNDWLERSSRPSRKKWCNPLIRSRR